MKKTLIKKNRFDKEQHECDHELDGENEPIILMPPSDPEVRILGLYGAIEEEKCAHVVASLMHLKEIGKKYVPINPDDPKSESKVEYEPIEMVISSEGGLVTDMFAVYDVMRDISKDCEINTFGIGKVMSAALLLLAAGTKGKRRIGRNCRLMIHPISSGNYGQLHDLQNSYAEANVLQEAYITELCSLTNLTKKDIKKLFKKKLDVYFDADQAVKWGIADIIV